MRFLCNGKDYAAPEKGGDLFSHMRTLTNNKGTSGNPKGLYFGTGSAGNRHDHPDGRLYIFPYRRVKDGCSTYMEYSPEEICIDGEAFSVSVWVAPRAFEWDDPDAAENGTEHLTGIVSQYDKNKKQGFILGYQRFGRLCFQAGTGEEWETLWGDGQNLN